MKNIKKSMLLLGVLSVLLLNNSTRASAALTLTTSQIAGEDWTKVTPTVEIVSDAYCYATGIDENGNTYFAFLFKEDGTGWSYLTAFDPEGTELWMTRISFANFTSGGIHINSEDNIGYLWGAHLNSTGSNVPYLLKFNLKSGEGLGNLQLPVGPKVGSGYIVDHPSDANRVFYGYNWVTGSPGASSQVIEFNPSTMEIIWASDLSALTTHFDEYLFGMGWNSGTGELNLGIMVRTIGGYTSDDTYSYIWEIDPEDGSSSGHATLALDGASISEAYGRYLVISDDKMITILTDGQTTQTTDDFFVQERSLGGQLQNEYQLYTYGGVNEGYVSGVEYLFSSDLSRMAIVTRENYNFMATQSGSSSKGLIRVYEFNADVDTYNQIETHYYGIPDQDRWGSIYRAASDSDLNVISIAGYLEVDDGLYSGCGARFTLEIADDTSVYEGFEKLYGPFLANENWIALGSTAGVFVIMGLLLGQIGKKKK